MDVYLVFQLLKMIFSVHMVIIKVSKVGIPLPEYEVIFHVSQTFTEQSVWHGLVPSSLYQAYYQLFSHGSGI